jgi:hypothetical protein
MTILFTALNIFFAFIMWNSASEAFEQNRNGLGWFLIAASATNAAAAASYFF